MERRVERHSTVLWPWETDDVAEAEALASGSATCRLASNHTLSDWTWCPFGFVAGCVWGDDSSWKIQFLDLSRAAEGVLVRDDRFGYAEMPGRMGLREAVDLSVWKPGNDRIGLSTTRWFALNDGGAEEI